MGRPAIARAIKRSRLRAAEMAADCAGQITPAALQKISAPCEQKAETVNVSVGSYDDGYAAGLTAARKAARKTAAKKKKAVRRG